MIVTQLQRWSYLHIALTGAIACPTRALAAGYGQDRCAVCGRCGGFLGTERDDPIVVAGLILARHQDCPRNFVTVEAPSRNG